MEEEWKLLLAIINRFKNFIDFHPKEGKIEWKQRRSTNQNYTFAATID
jgi:hypothetical protein